MPDQRAALLPPGVTAAQLGALRILADRLLADRDITAATRWLQCPRRKDWKRVAQVRALQADADAECSRVRCRVDSRPTALPWGKENYSRVHQKLLSTQGFLVVDGEFELGRVLFEEFSHYDPVRAFVAATVPALVVHGDRDSAVSYEIARQTASNKPGTTFHTITGSDHGFDTREREDEAVAVTVGWLAQR